jgi:hypothetical protein
MLQNETAALTCKADPLIWGHVPREFDVFPEITCLHSVRALGRLDALLERATVKIR